MVKAWIIAVVGTVLSMLILYLASYMGDSPFAGFPIFVISFALLSYTGTLVRKAVGLQG